MNIQGNNFSNNETVMECPIFGNSNIKDKINMNYLNNLYNNIKNKDSKSKKRELKRKIKKKSD